MAYELKIKLMGLPKTQNALNTMHWAKKSAHAKKWKRDVKLQCWSHLPPQPLRHASLKLIRASSRQPDYDGMVGSFKCLIDGLVEAKVLANDNPDVVGRPHYEWRRVAAKEGHVLIEVSDGL